MVWKSKVVRYKEIKSWNENNFKTHLTWGQEEKKANRFKGFKVLKCNQIITRNNLTPLIPQGASASPSQHSNEIPIKHTGELLRLYGTLPSHLLHRKISIIQYITQRVKCTNINSTTKGEMLILKVQKLFHME